MTNWTALAEPFPASEVKQRQGPKQHDGACQKQYGHCTQQHKMLSYIDARLVAQRLDDVVTPEGWEFTCEVAVTGVIKGRLVVANVVREDFGYPNSDDDAEPYKSAVSDALKRCAVLFGIGRHLYDDNKAPQRAPARPATPPRPTIVQPVPAEPAGLMDDIDDEPDDATCGEHGQPWIGTFGDRYHKKDEGGYCRTAPGNVAKARR